MINIRAIKEKGEKMQIFNIRNKRNKRVIIGSPTVINKITKYYAKFYANSIMSMKQTNSLQT